MRKMTRGAAALLLGSAMTVSAAAQAPVGQPPAQPQQTPPQPQQVQAPGGVAPAAPSVTPAAPEVRPTGVAATVNGQQIPEVDVYRQLRQFPPHTWDMARKEILAHLIENTLIDQYLTAIKMNVEAKEVETTIGELKTELANSKPPKDYIKELAAMMLTEAEFRDAVLAQMKWEKFVKQMATDAELKKTFDSSPDVFDGTLVRARHILLTPGSDPAKQKEAEGKLMAIKQQVQQEADKAVAALPPNQAGDKLVQEQTRAARTEEVFSSYAKEHSQCPSKANGGDLNYFPRAGAMVEPFAKAAYAVKPYQMTDVVVTEFGYHLILVTARKQGTPRKYEEVKEDVKLLYQMRLREAVIAQMKPKAQVSINPAPAYPQANAATPASGVAAPPATPKK
jgi:parvulin-like peptidyl-prolyl isomerase